MRHFWLPKFARVIKTDTTHRNDGEQFQVRAWAPSLSKACTGRRPTTATDLQKNVFSRTFSHDSKRYKRCYCYLLTPPWSHNGPLCLIKLQHTNRHLYSVTSHLATSAAFDSLEGNKTVFRGAIDVSSTVVKCLVWHKPLGGAPGFNTLTRWPNCAITMACETHRAPKKHLATGTGSNP